MRPVRTARSNLVYRGSSPDVRDLHCQRLEPGIIASVWEPSPAEREAIAKGANIQLFVSAEPHPPVQISITQEQGTGEDAPELQERLRRWRTEGRL